MRDKEKADTTLEYTDSLMDYQARQAGYLRAIAYYLKHLCAQPTSDKGSNRPSGKELK